MRDYQNSKHAEMLVGQLLSADVAKVPAILAEIQSYRHWAHPKLAEIEADPAHPDEDRWRAQLALQHGSSDLVEPLIDILKFSRSEPQKDMAAMLLANYGADHVDDLAPLVVEAEPRHAAMLLVSLRAHRERVIPFLQRELEKEPNAAMREEEKNDLVKRQANAAVALLQLGQGERVWPLLQRRPGDPAMRTYLIHRLALFNADLGTIIQRLETEEDASANAALILCLGEFAAERFSKQDRERLIARLVALYRAHADAAVHSAAEWILRRWMPERQLAELDSQLTARKDIAGRRWYLNGQGDTMVIIHKPEVFQMGSPVDEPDRNEDTEEQHSELIPRNFAVSTKEVTVKQFRKFLDATGVSRRALKFSLKFSRDEDGPIMAVTWFEAAQYCRWLSEQEGIPEEQMCYPPLARIKKGMKMPADYLARTGYRLPTEAEWEYACRAGAPTVWSFGASEEMLDKYAWYSVNSKNKARPVGRLKPNDFGIFDMHGNASEWTHTLASPFQKDPHVDKEEQTHERERVIRGGAYYNPAPYLRSAARMKSMPDLRDTAVGFRVARTHP